MQKSLQSLKTSLTIGSSNIASEIEMGVLSGLFSKQK
jgi:hypothetical protein